MANKTKGFVVASAVRPSGFPYWIVRGTIDGRQLRKEFSERSDALAFQEQKNSELAGVVDVGQANVLTRLPAEKVREAELAIAQLEREFPTLGLLEVVDYFRAVSPELPLEEVKRFSATFTRLRQKFPAATLADACDFFIDSYRPASSKFTLGEALELYAADVQRRHEKKTLSWWQMRSIRFATQRLEVDLGTELKLSSITTSRLHEHLISTSSAADGSRNFANKTWTNRRGYLTTFFEFCVQEGWLSANPATGIRNYTKREHAKPAPQILPAAKVRQMMADAEQFAEGRLVPYLVFTTFCGIRPTWREAEITRLKNDYVDLVAKEIRIPMQDTKTRKTRVTKIQPNVVRWLDAYPLKDWSIIPPNFRKLIIAFRKRHELGHDVLRHTFCSMLVGKTKSVADAALQAGNSEGVMWSSYLNLVTEKEAADFWSIKPSRSAKRQ